MNETQKRYAKAKAIFETARDLARNECAAEREAFEALDWDTDLPEDEVDKILDIYGEAESAAFEKFSVSDLRKKLIAAEDALLEWGRAVVKCNGGHGIATDEDLKNIDGLFQLALNGWRDKRELVLELVFRLDL